MGGGGGDVVDSEGEVVEAQSTTVRGVLGRIVARNGSNANNWISKRGVHPSSTSVMCWAFMSGMPM